MSTQLALPNMQNLVIIKEVTTPLRFDPDVKSLGFERLTMHPIQSKLILKSMLSAQESQVS